MYADKTTSVWALFIIMSKQENGSNIGSFCTESY